MTAGICPHCGALGEDKCDHPPLGPLFPPVRTFRHTKACRAAFYSGRSHGCSCADAPEGERCSDACAAPVTDGICNFCQRKIAYATPTTDQAYPFAPKPGVEAQARETLVELLAAAEARLDAAADVIHWARRVHKYDDSPEPRAQLLFDEAMFELAAALEKIPEAKP
jgi:hypothetical protein